MRLEDLVIPQEEALKSLRFWGLRERLQDLCRLRQARKNIERAEKQLELAKQVYRTELRHCGLPQQGWIKGKKRKARAKNE